MENQPIENVKKQIEDGFHEAYRLGFMHASDMIKHSIQGIQDNFDNLKEKSNAVS